MSITSGQAATARAQAQTAAQLGPAKLKVHALNNKYMNMSNMHHACHDLVHGSCGYMCMPCRLVTDACDIDVAVYYLIFEFPFHFHCHIHACNM